MSKYEIKEKYSFSETFNTVFQLSEKEKENISYILNSNIVETPDKVAFRGGTDFSDLYFTNSLVEISKTLYNDNLKESPNTKIIDKVKTVIATKPLLNEDIDLLSTVYGVMLGKNCGFEIDKQKLQNYISKNYNSIGDKDGGLEQINHLYYTIILDELNNDYHITCKTNIIQDFIDNSIKSLKFKGDITNDIIISRRILEIVMDLQIHDVDIHINNAQANKIKKCLKVAMDNEKIMNSILIVDLSIIDNILNTNLIKNNVFDRIYSSLTFDGGSKAILDNKYPTDIYTTFRFFAYFGFNNNYNHLSTQKKYVESLKVSDGVYCHISKIISIALVISITIGALAILFGFNNIGNNVSKSININYKENTGRLV